MPGKASGICKAQFQSGYGFAPLPGVVLDTRLSESRREATIIVRSSLSPVNRKATVPVGTSDRAQVRERGTSSRLVGGSAQFFKRHQRF
jgi:hypothetical protein